MPKTKLGLNHRDVTYRKTYMMRPRATCQTSNKKHSSWTKKWGPKKVYSKFQGQKFGQNFVCLESHLQFGAWSANFSICFLHSSCVNPCGRLPGDESNCSHMKFDGLLVRVIPISCNLPGCAVAMASFPSLLILLGFTSKWITEGRYSSGVWPSPSTISQVPQGAGMEGTGDAQLPTLGRSCDGTRSTSGDGPQGLQSGWAPAMRGVGNQRLKGRQQPLKHPAMAVLNKEWQKKHEANKNWGWRKVFWELGKNDVWMLPFFFV